MEQKEIWLKGLITETPQEGYELAIKLSRMGVKSTQPDIEVLKRLRKDYANNASSLTAASQVIAINFQTISAANNYWVLPREYSN
ncbi:hexameric tyrosine-coordinated heme protein [uncultured Aquimarina sp.]|uniref:hexameric tyrosine-coordinated heme protein n=1 Tax=uncultured Aquimarina sp. TaxID=575652 RepID=UPI00261B753F|nr:hexameric tyrosine-coordinated heme protein [uncultured Aquimarina sp.]